MEQGSATSGDVPNLEGADFYVNVEELQKNKQSIINDISIISFGITGAGKSSTGNTIVGKKVFPAGYGEKSITSATRVEESEINLDGYGKKRIRYIDTVGLFDQHYDHRDDRYFFDELLRCEEQERSQKIEQWYTKRDQKLKNGLYEILKLSKGKIAAFLFVTDTSRGSADKNVLMFKIQELLKTKDHFNKYLFMVFTHADQLIKEGVDKNEAEKAYLRDSTLDTTKEMLAFCQNRYIFVNNTLLDDSNKQQEYKDEREKVVRHILNHFTVTQNGKHFMNNDLATVVLQQAKENLRKSFATYSMDSASEALDSKIAVFVKNLYTKSAINAGLAGGSLLVGLPLTIIGIFLAPATFGASLAFTAVGITVSVATGGAQIGNSIYHGKKNKKVEKEIDDILIPLYNYIKELAITEGELNRIILEMPTEPQSLTEEKKSELKSYLREVGFGIARASKVVVEGTLKGTVIFADDIVKQIGSATKLAGGVAVAIPVIGTTVGAIVDVGVFIHEVVNLGSANNKTGDSLKQKFKEQFKILHDKTKRKHDNLLSDIDEFAKDPENGIFECPICCYVQYRAAPCPYSEGKHKFCKGCVEKFFENDPSEEKVCPVCREIWGVKPD